MKIHWLYTTFLSNCVSAHYLNLTSQGHSFQENAGCFQNLLDACEGISTVVRCLCPVIH